MRIRFGNYPYRLHPYARHSTPWKWNGIASTPHHHAHRSLSTLAAPSGREATSTHRCCPDQWTGPRVPPALSRKQKRGIPNALQGGRTTPTSAAASEPDNPARISPIPRTVPNSMSQWCAEENISGGLHRILPGQQTDRGARPPVPARA